MLDVDGVLRNWDDMARQVLLNSPEFSDYIELIPRENPDTYYWFDNWDKEPKRIIKELLFGFNEKAHTLQIYAPEISWANELAAYCLNNFDTTTVTNNKDFHLQLWTKEWLRRHMPKSILFNSNKLIFADQKYNLPIDFDIVIDDKPQMLEKSNARYKLSIRYNYNKHLEGQPNIHLFDDNESIIKFLKKVKKLEPNKLLAL